MEKKFIKKIKWHALILVGFFFQTSLLLAGEYVNKGVLFKKANITAGQELIVTNNLHLSSSDRANNYAKVSFVYSREDRTDVSTDADWQIKVTYRLYKTPSITQVGSLLLEHRSGVNDVFEASEIYSNMETGTKLEILNVETYPLAGSVPEDIKLELTLVSDVYYGIDVTSSPQPVINTTTENINWNYYKGAEEYELEWIFVDGENVGVGSGDLTNSIRITTTDTYYPLEDMFLTYPSGVLYFRVRGVGRHLLGNGDYSHKKYSAWSYQVSLPLSGNEFEPGKNWTSVTTFAEDAKSKKVVNFFDGSNRSRQIVTNLSTQEQSLVGETRYDLEGRQALSIIPAPDASVSMNYRNNFNLLSGGNAKTNYDRESGYPPMVSSAGASQYYSANNISNSIHRDHIPNANGYPYVQTRYTRDNTGRVSNTSGLGSSHKLGSTHETQSIYGTASSTQLKRLFGSNVGVSAHYRRNVSIDPNGQASVAYMDQYDRVIATALEGKADNLEDLSTYNPVTEIINLDDNNVLDLENHRSVSVSSISNTLLGKSYSFTYDLTGNILQSLTPCATCIYDLSIKVIDPNGEPVDLTYNGSTVTSILETDIGSSVVCSGTTYNISDITFTASFDEVGSYSVVKTLTLNQDAIDALISSLPSEMNAPNYGIIESGYVSDIDYTGCDYTCEQKCKTFVLADDPTLVEGTTPYIQAMSNCMMNQCDVEIENEMATFKTTDCGALSKAMQDQVRPGGKYFELGASDQFWNDVNANITELLDEGGNAVSIPDGYTIRDYLYETVDGTEHAYWQEAFAEQIVTQHPEYKHIIACVSLVPTKVYSDALSLIGDWDEAVAEGVIDPLNMYTTYSSGYGIPTPGKANWDDLMLSGNFYVKTDFVPYRTQLINEMLGFVDENDLGTGGEDLNGNGTFEKISLWEFAYSWKVHGFVSQPSPGSPEETTLKEKAWFLFYTVYNGLKEKTIAQYKKDKKGCVYLPAEENPIIYNPLDQPEPGYEVNSTISNGIEENCSLLCPEKVEIWYQKILAIDCVDKSAITDAVEASIKSELSLVCDQVCGFDNPMALLTDANIDAGILDATFAVVPIDASCDSGIKDSLNTGIDLDTSCTMWTQVNTCLRKEMYLDLSTSRTELMSNSNLQYTNKVSDNYLKIHEDLQKLLLSSSYGACNDPISVGAPKDDGSGVISMLSDIFRPVGQQYNEALYIYDPAFNYYGLGYDGCSAFNRGAGKTIFVTIPKDGIGYDYYTHVPGSYPTTSCDYGAKPGSTNGISINPQNYYVFLTTALGVNDDQCDPNYLIDLSTVVGFGEPYTYYNGTDINRYGNNPAYDSDVFFEVYLDDNTTVLAKWAFYPMTFTYNGILEQNYTINDVSCVSKWSFTSANPVFDGIQLAFFKEDGTQIDMSSTPGLEGIYKISKAAYEPVSDLTTIPIGWEYAKVAVTLTTYKRESFKAFVYKSTLSTGSLYKNEVTCVVTGISNPDENIQAPFDWDILSDACKTNLEDNARFWANKKYQNELDNFIDGYLDDYLSQCMSGIDEDFYYETQNEEHHYTLYYYDQAGNLVQTVPPQGVDDDFSGVTINAVTGKVTGEPDHSMETRYKYNSLNQIVWQNTPDGGITRFWYDSKGQLRLSQNEQQATGYKYSYTRYDDQGRIVEVGEYTAPPNYTPQIEDIDNQAFPTSSVDYITKTTYDEPYTNAGIVQQNLRGRVASVSSLKFDPGSNRLRGQVSTYYSYDAHGNVKEMSHNIQGLGTKVLKYEYDLVSGNVNRVIYQEGQPDQFMHKYLYDADNRITEVFTSKNGLIWERDARYFYYDHGPLARVEVGDDNVQGLDYYYTIQGWLKGINTPDEVTVASQSVLNSASDPGRDGNSGSVNKWNGRDEIAMVLGYFSGDYNPIGGSSVDRGHDVAGVWGSGGTFDSDLPGDNTGLYNGNISYMYTAVAELPKQFSGEPLVQAMVYKYDQLNRIKASRSYRSFTGSNWASGTNNYYTTYSYDKNGNISTLRRESQGTLMDQLSYSYASGKNRLRHVTDAVGAAVSTVDIDNQATDNYLYDAIGNMTKDKSEQINIAWTPYGKVRRVGSYGTSGNDIDFVYDGAGNRVKKKVDPDATTGEYVETFYVRDASGNVMAVYETENDGSTTTNSLKEHHIYGSSRLGYVDDEVVLSTKTNGGGTGTGTGSTPIGLATSKIRLAITELLYQSPFLGPFQGERPRGQYASLFNFGNQVIRLHGIELVDRGSGEHLTFGPDEELKPNQAMFITYGQPEDEALVREILQLNPNQPDASTVWRWQTEMTFSDNGGQLQLVERVGQTTRLIDQMSYGRGNLVTNNQRYTEQQILSGMERPLPESIIREKIVITDGRIYSIPENFGPGERDPIIRPPLEGDIRFEWPPFDPIRVGGAKNPPPDPLEQDETVTERRMGLKRYELTNHLGNVLAVVTDRKLGIGGATANYYQADVVAANDYYPFGMLMPQRNYTNSEYRYGFNGKEKDDEVSGKGNSYDYGFRIYNPRIAKFLSVDPLSNNYPMLTPYQFAGNTPVMAADIDGLEGVVKTSFEDLLKKQGISVAYQSRKVNGKTINTMIAIQHFKMPDGNTESMVVTLSNDGFTQKEINEMYNNSRIKLAYSIPFKYHGAGIGLRKLNYNRAFEGAPGSAMYTIGMALFNKMDKSLQAKDGRYDYQNMILHFSGQALATYIYGYDAAKYVAQIHERSEPERYTDVINGSAEQNLNLQFTVEKGDYSYTTSYESVLTDQLKDLFNNEYGRRYALKHLGRFRGSWTPERMANFLNGIQEYFENTFKGMKFTRFDVNKDREFLEKISNSVNKR